MKRPARLLARACLLAAGIAALVLGHGYILYYATSHAGLSIGAAIGIAVLLGAKLNLHLRRTRAGKEGRNRPGSPRR